MDLISLLTTRDFHPGQNVQPAKGKYIFNKEFDMFDINILDIIVIAASVFGGYTLPQPAWAGLLTEWIKKQFSKK